jgi:hypothetical protein
MNPEIRSYIEEARKNAMTDEQIRQNLAAVGWDAKEVEAVFADLAAEKQPAPAIPTAQPMPAAAVSSVPATATAAPAVVSSSSLSSTATVKSYLKKPWVIVVIICLVLAGSGYIAFKIYASPARIFNKFLASNLNQAYQTSFSASYFDAGSDSANNDFGISLKNITFSMTGKASVDSKDPATPKTDSDFTYTIGSGGTNFSTEMKIKLIGKDLYLNVGDNPLLNLVMGVSGNNKVDWIHINLQDAKSSSQGGALYSYITSDEFKKQISDTWQIRQIISPGKFLGTERINGTSTYHYAIAVNKQAIKDNFHKTLQQFAKADPADFPADTNSTLETVVNALVDRTEIKKFEAWIGIGDQHLYRIALETSAPSLASLAKISSSESGVDLSGGASTEAKRMADIRQLATALELYYNDKSGYPKTLQDMVPTYIGQIPTAPPGTGLCSDKAAGYTYSQEGGGSSYTLDSCLGKDTGGYKAGMIALTPSGIQTLSQCPASLPGCLLATPRSDNSMDKAIKDVIAKLDFTAQIKYNADYSDYGKSVPIEAPPGAKDLKDLMNSSMTNLENSIPAPTQ